MSLKDASMLAERLAKAGRIRLFLDYDGTLAEFAPTPDDILPDPEVIHLLTQLAEHPKIKLSVISGRRLAHVLRLLPFSGALLAGTYGVEMRLPEGEEVEAIEISTIRPYLDELKPKWEALLANREGFFLEDKGWALGIHARRAEEDEAGEVLSAAEELLAETLPGEDFRVLGGFKFIEVGPASANKGHTIETLLERYPWTGAEIVYIGDDDKDEEAFEVINAHGGASIVVAAEPRPTLADYRLRSPREVRDWLKSLYDSL